VKTIIFAGGLGTRFSEETENKPKPMILIDHRPILWHILDIYASQGFNDFVIATGYKSEVIEEWIDSLDEDWKVQAINTGLNTQTGGRLRKCLEELEGETFFATYGDGLGNINLRDLIDFHNSKKATITATAVRPPARFGYMEIDRGRVTKFGEKNQVNEGWINGGFFILTRDIVNHIIDDYEPLETGALTRLSKLSRFYAFLHNGFWFPMDTRSEQLKLSAFARQNPPPWKVI
jgi:glucose-1-phosphate cytidylyltransferase